jgi:hypothetical protein
MEGKEFINKIKELREIKPNQNWVISTKFMILGQEQEKKNLTQVLEFFPRLVLKHSKLAFALVITFSFLTGAFTFAQNSLPGDPFYALKKITEKSAMALTSEKNIPMAQLQLVSKRLDELNRIAEKNQMNKLAIAIGEFQASISKAADDLVNAKDLNVKEIVSETKKINETKDRVESLGVVVGNTDNLDNAYLQLIERQLKDLEVSSLTDSQKEVFKSAVEDFNAGNYSDSLEKIWSLSSPQQ